MSDKAQLQFSHRLNSPQTFHGWSRLPWWIHRSATQPPAEKKKSCVRLPINHQEVANTGRHVIIMKHFEKHSLSPNKTMPSSKPWAWFPPFWSQFDVCWLARQYKCHRRQENTFRKSNRKAYSIQHTAIDLGEEGRIQTEAKINLTSHLHCTLRGTHTFSHALTAHTHTFISPVKYRHGIQLRWIASRDPQKMRRKSVQAECQFDLCVREKEGS